MLWLVITGITGLSLGGSVWLWFFIHRTDARTKILEARVCALQDDVAALCTCQATMVGRDQARNHDLEQYTDNLLALENRLEAIEQRLRQLARRQDEQLNPGEPGETSYGAAIRLANQGANVEQLVNTFGLARGEAELIAALHHAQNEQK